VCFVPDKSFQASKIFVGKARSLPQILSTYQVLYSELTERKAIDKHYSLFCNSDTEEKKFVIKMSLGVLVALDAYLMIMFGSWHMDRATTFGKITLGLMPPCRLLD